MLLDYERYQRKAPKKRIRLVVAFLLVIALGLGGYFLITHFLRDDKTDQPLAPRATDDDVDALWTSLIKAEQTIPQADERAEEQKKLLDKILAASDAQLKEHPLALKTLLYYGFGSFYRALYEPSFETQLPYLNQAVVAERRALKLAGSELKPQLCYMLGRAYYFKRNYYYDLSARYLEQALKLGYKKVDVFEYLVLIYNDWGDTEKAIGYLEQANAEKKNDLYLFYLAKSYKKVKRTVEAGQLLRRIMADSTDAELLKECQFLLGEILFDQADYSSAERLYRDILKADANSAEAHFRLALIFEKRGDYAQYRYELRLTLEIDRGHSGARSRM